MTAYTDFLFTAEHEWLELHAADSAGTQTATVGITAYAADKLGDVVYVDLPQSGTNISAGAVVGEIESTKSVGELFAPVSGEVVEKNAAVEERPELVNSDPFGEGWLIRVRFAELPEGMLTYQQYSALIGDENASA